METREADGPIHMLPLADKNWPRHADLMKTTKASFHLQYDILVVRVKLKMIKKGCQSLIISSDSTRFGLALTILPFRGWGQTLDYLILQSERYCLSYTMHMKLFIDISHVGVDCEIAEPHFGGDHLIAVSFSE